PLLRRRDGLDRHGNRRRRTDADRLRRERGRVETRLLRRRHGIAQRGLPQVAAEDRQGPGGDAPNRVTASTRGDAGGRGRYRSRGGRVPSKPMLARRLSGPGGRRRPRGTKVALGETVEES